MHGIAADDMRLIDESDAILAYFEKKEQVGTLTELVYAVTRGKTALVLFDQSFAPAPESHWAEISEGIEYQHAAPTYWFLINFLSGDGWGGLDADVTLSVVESREDIKTEFRQWNWHLRAAEDAMTPNDAVEPSEEEIHRSFG